MEESILYNVKIVMVSGRVYTRENVTNTEIDWMYDRMFGRETGNFQNFENFVFNIDEVETFEYQEIEQV